MSIQPDLSGKVYIVTGANSGIGFQAAKNFAERGATVALVCRSKERGEQAVSELVLGAKNSNIKLYLADFSLLSSVSRVADELLRDYPKVDVLCNNAGGANGTRSETADGLETTFATNHLAGFLLTTKLLPSLTAAANSGLARVVFTSSYGHTHSALDFNDLNLAHGYSILKAYGHSKLMNLLTAREFHRRYKDTNVVASSFHPGAVRTPIWGKGGLLTRIVGIFAYPFMVNVKQGTDTFIWLASSDEEEAIKANGRYYFKRKRAHTAKFATDEAAEKLWNASMKLIEPFL
ncbi:MAG: hypothetical protein COA96_07265 [SAR86 cluster bacterium]|uniref:Short-chain dehydrogenase n=1 Tax=SAR86 cluster bacterium TaxID=2030880 RepID=A0A2A5B2Y3_9GAMM|nr:MAG: hypothetical protein COA96_07265 [SAR86 cluster bacterium]